ncbi:hypothetical protein KQI77_05805 [Clostridium sp. MSJ-8]|uniref:hypothetical protein n=1 Tax=Clostridium sp. MSJ-8 TaxID=2841510 RepID=UPI001C0EDC44|nr:hypothetical protein [Clostridium sp. MSJ-8]MBU5487680.1 hypothetical protein [Clostridium sp. MSJ-8]
MIDNLKTAISENDIAKARRILVNELICKDYPYEVYRDAMDLAEECGVFDEHNNMKLSSDPKEWDRDYLNELVDELQDNFSKERFLTAYYVARKIDKYEKKQRRKLDEECDVLVTDSERNYLNVAKVSAIVAGVTALGVGLLLVHKFKKK